MPTRSDFQQLAQTRLEEAQLLYNNSFYDGAVYLAGYSLELALKARICFLLDSDYPEGGEFKQTYFSHRYATLLRLAGLEKKLAARKVTDTDFATSWSVLTDPLNGWNESFRYRTIGSSTQSRAAEVLDALENPTYGVLTWLKQLW